LRLLAITLMVTRPRAEFATNNCRSIQSLTVCHCYLYEDVC